MTPFDLRNQRFRKSFRGFDAIEVTSFLGAIADDYEQALREADQLRQNLSRLEAMLDEHREAEKNLRNTLLTAQRLSDGIRNNAEAEAERMIREAEARSALLLEKAQAHVEDVQREIDGLRLKRKEAETSLEASIQMLRNTLEFVREQEAREREERKLERSRNLGPAATPAEVPAVHAQG